MRLHLSAEAAQTLNEQQLQGLLERYRPLGRLVEVKEMEFSRLMSVFSLFGDKRVSYAGTAQFENHAASFTITLSEQHSVFSIYSLNISID